MLEKIKKNRKIIVVIIIILVVALGFILPSILNRKKVATNIETSTEEENKIKNLASKAGYKILNQEEKDFMLVIPEKSLDEEEFKNFIKEVHSYGKQYGEELISFQVFSDEQYAQKLQSFYTEGLLKDVKIDFNENKAIIGTFERVPAIEKSEFINDYTEGKISSKEGNIVITMDMTFEGENPVNVVANAKAFCELFKSANQSKDIKSIELHLNENSDTNQYRFNNLFGEILEKMEVVNY
ncbi:MAG: hypothetical protein SOY42_01220 [Clostridium sp.]|nr:hypothetical protein [Clostridium sp.]